ncbi:phosphatase PAP2 family protein [Allosalinactinospora lopnorensis]|uniref:phosphatase PAP2 family protein n=1 Tax=Allosalinactinospora lopnorensis TaxID=1352348 RepID=UPI00069901B9|nr:phosphatase PAP2 family protein [Allosalinactinospora lopnorensis]
MASDHTAAARGWWRPYAVGLMAAGTILALVTWQVVARGPLTALDWPTHEYLAARQPEGAAHTLAVGAARLGQRWLTAPILLLVGVWGALRRRDPRPVLAAVTGLVSLAVLGGLLKVYVGRTPPLMGIDMVDAGLGNVADGLGWIVTLGAVPFDGFVSYPSGHTANAALTYPLLAFLLFGPNGVRPSTVALRRTLAASPIPVLIVGAMMALLDYHWVTEALGGLALGAVVALLGRLVLGPGGTGAGPAAQAGGRCGR